MTYRLGILPAAGKAVRFGGVLKELLPLPNSLSFLYEAYLRLEGYCDDIVIVTNHEKITEHARELASKTPYFAFQRGANDIYSAIETAIRFQADEYLFTMPDTFMNRDAFKGYEGADFALGCHMTDTPERFGCFFDGHISNKMLISTPATAWSVLAWTKKVADYWKLHEPISYTGAINQAIDKFGYSTWMLDFNHDNASIADYRKLMGRDLT